MEPDYKFSINDYLILVFQRSYERIIKDEVCYQKNVKFVRFLL